MRSFRLLACLSLIAVQFAAAPAAADAGAVVSKGTYPGVWWFWNDYEIKYIAIFSSDPMFATDTFCSGVAFGEPTPEWKLITFHEVVTASGKDNFSGRGPVFVRVYGLFSTPLPVDGSFFSDAWLCEVLSGREGVLFAEGTTHVRETDINICKLSPGQNAWHIWAVGNLHAPLCPSRMAHFNMDFHYMLTSDAIIDPGTCAVDDPAHIRLVVIRGPELSCIGK